MVGIDQKTIIVCGEAAVGKTSVIAHLMDHARRSRKRVSLAKIDCLHTEDGKVYERLGMPYLTALSGDICPDHFLVSNLEELSAWSAQNGTPTLVIETAGLCNRCCPTTKASIGVCVVDCSASLRAPQKIGPMLTTGDVVVLTKIDRVSQAEREIMCRHIAVLCPNARVFCVDALTGQGCGTLWRHLDSIEACADFAGDRLRHTMPTGVCSYCVGEKRIGTKYQQGMVEKIDIKGCAHV